MIRELLVGVILCAGCGATAAAQVPEWTRHLPFCDEYIYGNGEGVSPETARERAKQVVLMQLSSQVRSAILEEDYDDSEHERVSSSLTEFLGYSSLRGLREEAAYVDGERHYVLMKYPADCGKRLIFGAVYLHEEQLRQDVDQLLATAMSRDTREGVRMQWRLSELNLDDYSSEDITVSLVSGLMTIRILNFLADTAEPSPAQATALEQLSKTLFVELQNLSYRSVEVVGHANRTGTDDEEDELQTLSRQRAGILAAGLRSAGLRIDRVRWAGGDEPLSDPSTETGRARNRRVEIFVQFEREDD